MITNDGVQAKVSNVILVLESQEDPEPPNDVKGPSSAIFFESANSLNEEGFANNFNIGCCSGAATTVTGDAATLVNVVEIHSASPVAGARVSSVTIAIGYADVGIYATGPEIGIDDNMVGPGIDGSVAVQIGDTGRSADGAVISSGNQLDAADGGIAVLIVNSSDVEVKANDLLSGPSSEGTAISLEGVSATPSSALISKNVITHDIGVNDSDFGTAIVCDVNSSAKVRRNNTITGYQTEVEGC
jgi:hypothetical protein